MYSIVSVCIQPPFVKSTLFNSSHVPSNKLFVRVFPAWPTLPIYCSKFLLVGHVQTKVWTFSLKMWEVGVRYVNGISQSRLRACPTLQTYQSVDKQAEKLHCTCTSVYGKHLVKLPALFMSPFGVQSAYYAAGYITIFRYVSWTYFPALFIYTVFYQFNCIPVII